MVRIEDAARVELGAEIYAFDPSSMASRRHCWRLPISWSQSPASGKWVRAELRRLVQRRPEDVAHAIALGTTTFVSGRIEEIFSTLLITFLLVVVVFLFLQPAAPS
jgi:multidrug efflux pump subunit AcrB